jgi:hypothetical protein
MISYGITLIPYGITLIPYVNVLDPCDLRLHDTTRGSFCQGAGEIFSIRTRNISHKDHWSLRPSEALDRSLIRSYSVSVGDWGRISRAATNAFEILFFLRDRLRDLIRDCLRDSHRDLMLTISTRFSEILWSKISTRFTRFLYHHIIVSLFHRDLILDHHN